MPAASAPPGYFGRALHVDVGSGRSEHVHLSERRLRDFIGGCGLGASLVLDGEAPETDALAPEAPVALVFSPLVGTPLTTSAKFAVVAKSPLSGLLNDALCSSHFAIAGKLSGNDAIVIRGRCDHPSTLIVDAAGARLEPADALWGLPAAAAEESLRERLGPAYRVCAIGPAGERLTRFATLSHDGRHAGRGGHGAVLGSKRLKAIAVRASTKVGPAHPERVLRLAQGLRAASRSAATRKYSEHGTLANLLAFNAISALPTRNFRDATF
ncbi:MAG: aldehyde ferredoxin oxidoreductase N-terminal domain-containing protein, partial [Gaiellales bacterium]